MIRSSTGRILTSVKDRRDEVTRCLKEIGWSWPVFAERTGHAASMGSRYKYCKQPVPDEDIDYVQRLAKAVVGVPRQKPSPGLVGLAKLEALDADMSVILGALAEVWVDAEVNLDAGPSRETALATLAEVAEKLGLEDMLVREVNKKRKELPPKEEAKGPQPWHLPLSQEEADAGVVWKGSRR